MRKFLFIFAGILLASAGSLVSAATTFSWNANTTGDWFAAANWTNNSGYPSDGDTVTITNVGSSVVLSNNTARLADLTLGGASAGQRTLSFTNWDTCLYATNMTILTNGYLTCAGPFTTNSMMSNRVNLVCYSKLAIEGGGAINVNGKGYAGGSNLTGQTYMPGNGPGAVMDGIKQGPGSHGGAGRTYMAAGQASGGLLTSKVYDSDTAPLYPGSGGSAGNAVKQYGGNGGGAVCITAAQAGVCRQVLKSDGFRFAFLCSFFSYPILFNDPFEVSRHPDSDRG